MFAKLLEILSGKDDMERVACQGNIHALIQYLRSRPLIIPLKPRRYLDAISFTQEELKDLIEEGTQDLANDRLEPWILEVNGQRRLPVFSSHMKIENFSAKISQELNKVFALNCVELLPANIKDEWQIDILDLNLYSKRSWELEWRK